MPQKIKAAIDISPLNDGNSVRGVGYYTKNLVAALQSEIKINPAYKNFQIDLVTQKRSLIGYDLVHYPYFDPFQSTLPAKNTIPTIVTIHDLIPRQFKSHFPVGIKGELIWLKQRYLAHKSKYIITVSEYSKTIISKLLNYPPENIFVTYEAADPSFTIIKNTKLLATIKSKYHLPDKFILYIGDINWNKNIPNLVKSCLKLKYPLVIVGSAATKKVPVHPWTKDIHWLQSQTSPLLTLTGFVPDSDLPAIINLATIYCQPSYAEGFGLPVVQAMQIGLPIVYSQETCLPEIMAQNGLSFDPYSRTSLENTLMALWDNQDLRNKFKTLGIDRSKIFSWQQTARQTLAVYQKATINGR